MIVLHQEARGTLVRDSGRVRNGRKHLVPSGWHLYIPLLPVLESLLCTRPHAGSCQCRAKEDLLQPSRHSSGVLNTSLAQKGGC